MRGTWLFLYQPFRYALAALVLAGIQATPAAAYTTVKVSPSSPAGLEESFIAATTGQFSATVLKNPFVAGTWQVTLQGPNPAYNPPVTSADLLRSLVTVSTQSFLYGFRDGMEYQHNLDINATATLGNLCDHTTNFMLYSSTWPLVDVSTWTAVSTMTYVNKNTFHANTCRDVLWTLLDIFFEMNLSTPTVIPPNGF